MLSAPFTCEAVDVMFRWFWYRVEDISEQPLIIMVAGMPNALGTL